MHCTCTCTSRRTWYWLYVPCVKYFTCKLHLLNLFSHFDHDREKLKNFFVVKILSSAVWWNKHTVLFMKGLMNSVDKALHTGKTSTAIGQGKYTDWFLDCPTCIRDAGRGYIAHSVKQCTVVMWGAWLQCVNCEKLLMAFSLLVMQFVWLPIRSSFMLVEESCQYDLPFPKSQTGQTDRHT